MITAKLNVVQ